VVNLVPVIKSYVRSIKDEIPDRMAKAQITNLDTHAQFIEVYTKKRDLGYVLSNAQSIRPDIQRLRVALGVGGKDELREAVERLPLGPERDLLEEAIGCLEAESPRAAIVMAVCSLENVLRRFYESKIRTDSKKLDFWRVIDEVAKMQGLSESERCSWTFPGLSETSRLIRPSTLTRKEKLRGSFIWPSNKSRSGAAPNEFEGRGRHDLVTSRAHSSGGD
jgi:hypothetical protein